MLDKYYRTWAEIDLDAVRKNIEGAKTRLQPETKVCAVVKADGYGLGAVPIAKATEDLVDFYAVATIDEAYNLREHGIKHPIVVLGFVHESSFEYAIEEDIRIAAFDLSMIDKLNSAAGKLGKKAKIHIAVDTGMHRIGIPFSEAGLDFVKKVKAFENIELEGMFTHFYLSDAENKASAYAQYYSFKTFIGLLETIGITIPVKHCANSAAALEMFDTNLDMVRIGITLYGMYPSDEITSFEVTPVFSLRSHIIMVKEVKTGDTVGYGGNFKAERDSIIATVPIGYADGYRRALSGKGAAVLIRGRRVPIAGRICMDMLMLDITDFPDIIKGDVVTLIGRDGNDYISIEELTEPLDGTINYDFSCSLGRRVPRIYIKGGEIVLTKDYIYDEYK